MKPINLKALNQRVIQSFNTKNFKYGGYATLLTIIAIGILIIINLIAEQIPLTLDLSKNKIFSLSEQTYQIVSDLDRDITIYALYETGRENTDITTILKKYTDHSDKIQLKYIDPNKNPGFAKQYTKDGKNLSIGSLIVESGKRFKIIPASDLFNFDYSNPYQPSVTSLAVEQRVTGAIMFVKSGKIPVIYALEGHGEQSLPMEIRKQLETENYELKSVNLYTASIPDDINILLVNSPQRDLTMTEVDKIREFLGNKGRAIFLVDLLRNELPNFQTLLRSYGVAIQPIAIVEGDNNHYIQNNPLWLQPEMGTHQIIEPLVSDKMPVIMPVAQGIKILDVKRRSLNIEPLLTTSAAAWGKTDLNTTSLTKTKDDLKGPFNVAVAITDESANPEGGDSRIVVVGNGMFLASDLINSIPGNANFLMNSFSWLQDQKVNLAIKPKSLLTMRLNINFFQSLLLSGIVVILIPLGILCAGLVVWLRRRHL